MKENKEESKIIKEEKIIDRKYIKESILTGKNAPVYNKKPDIVTNYLNNSKQIKNKKFTPRCSFRKDTNKTNIISTNKNDKISLNKTLDQNTNKKLMKKTVTTKNINELRRKRNSLCINTKNDISNNVVNNNNKLRKSLVIMTNNQKKLSDKRGSLVLQKNINNAIASKDGTKGVLDKIIEKNEDKKEIDNYEVDLDNLDKRFKSRAYSKKITERDRQKKMEKLNKDSFGEVAKYTKKTAQFVKRDKKEIIKNNVFKNLKVKNERMMRTKTNSNLINNENIIRNNINKDNNEGDWSNRDLTKVNNNNNKNVQKKLLKKMKTNLYDKYNNNRRENKVMQNNKNTKGENIRNNILYRTITNKSILHNNKSNIKNKNKNGVINNKKKINENKGKRMPSKDLNRGKSAIYKRDQDLKNNKKNINNKNINKNKISNKNVPNKSVDVPRKKINNNINKIKPKNDKSSINIKQKKVESESDESDEEEDENDFDIYAMIRSKSCLRKKKDEKKKGEDENSEEKEKKSFNSEEDCDIDNVLYGKEEEKKEKKKPFMSIIEDDNDGKNSIIKCIDFEDVFLTTSDMFTENIEKNKLYNKYIQKFDDIYDKMLLKFKENLKSNNSENIKEASNVFVNEKEKEEDNNFNDIQSEVTKSE